MTHVGCDGGVLYFGLTVDATSGRISKIGVYLMKL